MPASASSPRQLKQPASETVETMTINIAQLIDNRSTLQLTNSGNEEWRKTTEASLEEYREHHQAGHYPENTLHQMSMFEGFIAKWGGIWNAKNMLDLGCGIGATVPPYARNIGASISYVGLDPLRENLKREYPFICGRLEDLAAEQLNQKFDMALFATSLDHFEDAREALILAGLTTNEGRLVIWCGIHDSPETAVEDVSPRILRFCRTYRGLLSRILGAFGFTLFVWPRIAWALFRRERNLGKNKPLDNLHFHYFTIKSLRSLLNSVGRIDEFVHCPGSNSVFAAVTLAPESPLADQKRP